MLDNRFQIIITGSSGYVGKSLSSLLEKYFSCIKYADISAWKIGIQKCSISDHNFLKILDIDRNKPSIIINLAAARFDFGVKAEEYYDQNVKEHKAFLKNIEDLRIIKFIHISSVASIDGKNIQFINSLNCDDAYRSTKFLQEELIMNWCDNKSIDNITIYPSAIFSDEKREDTNIGKLQNIVEAIKIFPKIVTKKSLTYLPHLNNFILDGINGKIKNGKYLTIENPVLSVSEIASYINKDILQFRIPFLKHALYAMSYCFFLIGGFGRIDTKLTPNRVNKLFSDTSYKILDRIDIDKETYNSRNNYNLSEILSSLSKDK